MQKVRDLNEGKEGVRKLFSPYKTVYDTRQSIMLESCATYCRITILHLLCLVT